MENTTLDAPTHDVLARLDRAFSERWSSRVRAGTLPETSESLQSRFETCRNPAMGDVATSAAMANANRLGMRPMDLAEAVAEVVRECPGISSATVAKPGFVNASFAPGELAGILADAAGAGTGYGRAPENGRIVNVEYVSANPTGPLHVGHARGAVVGDVIADMLAFGGAEVTKEYYVNDAGGQVDILARSTMLRCREAKGEAIGEIPKGLYPGEYLVPIGADLAASEAAGTTLDLDAAGKFAIGKIMEGIAEDLRSVGIRHDAFTSERDTMGDGTRLESALGTLREKGLVRKGTTERPHEADADWEDREQDLFLSTTFGDDKDRPLLKADGTHTYFASDIVYHADKAERLLAEAAVHPGKRPEMIDVWGADHYGYVKRMQGAVRAITDGKVPLSVVLCQVVQLVRDGKAVPMSKRAGEYVTLREVVDEVGVDAFRFMMLMRKSDTHLEFDLEKVVRQNKDNPVFYVQYAHARCHSALRMAAEAGSGTASGDPPDMSVLNAPEERAVLSRVLGWPRVLRQATDALEPHRIPFFLAEAAGEFHAMWTAGNRDKARRIVTENEVTTRARLALVSAMAAVLGTGLGLLGVSAPTRMDKVEALET